MKARKNLLISAITVAVLLCILWVLCPICFQNDDDKVLLYLTAGYTTGSPEMGTIFGSFYYYAIVCLLYRITGGLCWYTIMELAMIAVSLVAICYCTFTAIKKENYILGIALFILMFLTIFAYFSAALQYTATAALVGGAAACLILMDREDRGSYVAACILLALSYGIRKQFGMVSLSAIAIILLVQWLFEPGSLLKRPTFKRGLIMVAVFAVCFLSNRLYENATGITKFNDYYAEAGYWIDYPHLTYEEDTAGVYEAAGWDETLYNAASNWFFMDENLTLDNFTAIHEGYDAVSPSIKDRLKAAYNLVSTCPTANTQIAVWIVLLILVNALMLMKRHTGFAKRLITLNLLFLMFAAVSVYFLLQARFPLRVYQALLYIYFVPSIVIILQYFSDNCEDRGIIIAGALMAVALVVTAVIKPAACMPREIYAICQDDNRAYDIAQSQALEQYAIAHPDNIYIYDLSLSLPAAAFTVYEDAVPHNCLFWGGWVYNTPMYWKQVSSNGKDTLYTQDFLSGNVYFCGTEVSEELIQYMLARQPGVKCDIIDEFEGITVYQFYQ